MQTRQRKTVPSTTYLNMLASLWQGLAPRRRNQFLGLMVLMLVASVAEVISVGAVIPFLAALTAPERLYQHHLVQPLVGFFGLSSPQEMLLPVTVVFCLAALSAGGVRLLMLWAITRYSYAVGADLSRGAYRRTLYQPYRVHISRNSSEVINGILGKSAMMIGSVLTPLLNLASAIILLVGILLVLLAVDPAVAIGAVLAFTTIYGVILRATRRRLAYNSEVLAKESTAVVKALQEGLGGIRDVLLDGTQETYCQIYIQADRPLRQAQGEITFISASPRYVIEIFGIVLMTTLAYAIAQRDGSVATVVPVLGVLALGMQRTLPILQQAYSSLTILRGAGASLRDMLALLEQPLPVALARTALPGFHRELVLQNLGFRYADDLPWVVREVNLCIPRGSRIGFIGVTGSGKSTLLDIVMGLLEPSEGRLLVDGIALDEGNRGQWQEKIAHVPQSIYLADTSIKENIAFGVPADKIDMVRVRQCARQAQIDDIIESWPGQYDGLVGERGVRLSGGQRQRIGIARALYKKADVIILDEATSALDNDTERTVMEAIDKLGPELTVLIVAHRLTTLKNCDLVVELAGGGIRRSGSYQKLVAPTW